MNYVRANLKNVLMSFMDIYVFKGYCNGSNTVDVCRWERERRWVSCPSPDWSDAARKRAVQYAAYQISKPYNYNFTDKMTQAKFYCSQLIWWAYQHAISVGAWDEPFIDLDSNGGLTVSPDDIKSHPDIKVFNVSDVTI